MSLECSLEGIPGVIVYKANPLTYLCGRAIVKISYLSIANIILDAPAWREYIQFAANPNKIAQYMERVLYSPEARNEAELNAGKLREALKAPANMSAAEWLVKNL